MKNKKPFTEKVISSLDSLSRYNEQWHNFGIWLSWTTRIVAVILVSLNAAFLLPNQRYLTLWNTIPMYWQISDLEFFLLVGGLLSSIFLFFYLASILFKIIRFVAHLISVGYNKIITEPIQNLFIWVVQSIKQSRLWQYFYNLGQTVGYTYMLYPSLPYLEPANDRQNITFQTFEELPPEAYSDEHFCENTLQRYNGLGDNILLLTVVVSVGLIIFPFVLLGMFIRLASIIAPLLPSIFSDLLIWLILLATTLSPFIFLLIWQAFGAGCVTPYKKRKYAWALCQYQLQRKRELEEQARDIEKGIGQQLQVSIEKFVLLYKKEFQKTQDMKQKFEEATKQLMHLGEQPQTDEKTIKSLIWLAEFIIDQRREVDTAVRERESREGRISDIVISLVVGFAVSAFFFILSTPGK